MAQLQPRVSEGDIINRLAVCVCVCQPAKEIIFQFNFLYFNYGLCRSFDSFNRSKRDSQACTDSNDAPDSGSAAQRKALSKHSVAFSGSDPIRRYMTPDRSHASVAVSRASRNKVRASLAIHFDFSNITSFPPTTPSVNAFATFSDREAALCNSVRISVIAAAVVVEEDPLSAKFISP